MTIKRTNTMSLSSGGGGAIGSGSPFTGGGSNRVLYLDSSQLVATASTFTFDGTNLVVPRVGPNATNYIYSVPTGDGDISFKVNNADFINFSRNGGQYIVNYASATQHQVAGTTSCIFSDSSAAMVDVRGRMCVRQGGGAAGTDFARVGGVIFDHAADSATTHVDGTEDDLYSDTIPASSLGVNNDKISAEYCLALASSATATRRVKAYYGGTLILDSGTQTFAAAGTANIWITVIRESSTVVRVKAELVVAGITLQPVVTYTRITGLTLTNTQILKLTGIAAGTGAAASDIAAKLGYVEWKPAI